MFALSSKDADSGFLIIAYFPIIVFWILDAFFLRQEKLYRELYNEVASAKSVDSDFCMSTSRFEKNVKSIIFIAFSKTLLLFHGTVVMVVVFATFYLNSNWFFIFKDKLNYFGAVQIALN